MSIRDTAAGAVSAQEIAVAPDQGAAVAPAPGAVAPDASQSAAFTCIRCPLGCALRVMLDGPGGSPRVTGNQCVRGERYGADEATHPVRTVTACVCVPGALEPLSAKTAAPVERSRVCEVARAMGELKVLLPVKAGDVLSRNVAGTGVAVVATKDLP